MAKPRAQRSTGTLPVLPSNSLVASAARLTRQRNRIEPRSADMTWQQRCYYHYSVCGEARFAAEFFGHALSRAELYVDEPGNGDARVESGPAYDALAELFNGKDGQAQMLKAAGIHLTIAGEFYLIGRTVDGFDLWEIVAPTEIQVEGNVWSIQTGQNAEWVPLADSDVVIRIWRPRPGRRMEADSPFRSLLSILDEIEWMTKDVFSQIRSRLKSAGLLFLPEGMTFPKPEGQGAEDLNEADAFLLMLAQAFQESLKGDGSASEVAPTVVMAPGDEIEKAKLMTFWTELDSESKELRAEAIRRFALGMDLPPEQILGMSGSEGTGGGNSNGVSHWGAWQIEEATIKMHIEPMLELVCNALTVEYLRPDLPEGSREYVAYDSSALRLRPDRSQEAMELYDRGLVSAQVVLRETGFDPDKDGMTNDERKEWLLLKIAGGSATPEQVGAALEHFGIRLALDPGTPQGEVRESRPSPSLEQHPTRPRTPEEAALLAACDGLVLRALEKAGNRYINANRRGKDRDRTIDPIKFHTQFAINGDGPTLLQGAFTYAPNVLDGIEDTQTVVSILQNYCLSLFASGEEHTRERLMRVLEAHR